MADFIELQPIPNQSFNITLGNQNYDLRIFSIDGHMGYYLVLNGNSVIRGFKLVNNVMLLPYEYQEVNGNLLLVVPGDELPDYTRFGETQFLYYLDATESALYRNAFDKGLNFIPEEIA